MAVRTTVVIRTRGGITTDSFLMSHRSALLGYDKFQQPHMHEWKDWTPYDARSTEPLAPGVRYLAPCQANCAAMDVDRSETFNPKG